MVSKLSLKRVAFMGLAACLCLLPKVGLASLQTLLIGNESRGLEWLAENRSQSNLNLLVQDNLQNVSGAVAPSAWQLNLGQGGRAGDWQISSATFVPRFWTVKFGEYLAIYEYSGNGTWSDSFNLDEIPRALRRLARTLQLPVMNVNGHATSGAGSFSGLDFHAGTTQLSVYGSVMVPEPGTLAVWSLLSCVACWGGIIWKKRA